MSCVSHVILVGFFYGFSMVYGDVPLFSRVFGGFLSDFFGISLGFALNKHLVYIGLGSKWKLYKAILNESFCFYYGLYVLVGLLLVWVWLVVFFS